ncbi:MAG TPA: hypothetical protein VK911_16405 [Vicinamibacterales bacterium]|nr:hypothetical protein [Vicinamibacterales bacterium]
MMRRCLSVCVILVIIAGTSLAAQQPPVPRPFPRPAEPAAPPQQQPAQPAQQPPQQQPAQQQPAAVTADPGSGDPTEAMLGLPVYPTAEFLVSYDAGRGQRYYLFGTNMLFAEVVAYYRSVLKQRGDLVFEEPATHMFTVGRFREETMAFPPGVTVKDYTWGGMGGYYNPKFGAEPPSFKTVIQIVPAPAAAGGEARR